ncbi:hypothetical protein FACS189429_2110 [Bacteroidia bacterium]|nr:hypothetical protein FACS189429_2110 [Bacteroidia bacterium]
MKKSLIILSAILLIASGCKLATKNNSAHTVAADCEFPNDYYRLLEKFVDSVAIGKKGLTKMEIAQYENVANDDCFVRIFFYHAGKQKTDWWISNQFIFSDCAMSLLPEMADFNNDGYNDFTYHSIEGARGANDTRKLFIYNPENEDFIYIENSEAYPNLLYNKKLDCITSYTFTGSQDEYFLKLEKDSLFEFAHIKIESDSIFVYEYTEKKAVSNERFTNSFYDNGNEKLIEKRENTFGDFPYFLNYKPLE